MAIKIHTIGAYFGYLDIFLAYLLVKIINWKSSYTSTINLTHTVLEKALQSSSLCISMTTNIMSLTPHLISNANESESE
jgi:hypothetical protein